MSSQSISQGGRSLARRTTRRHSLVVLGLLVAVAAVAIAVFAAMPARSPLAAAHRPVAVDPAAQSVLAYLDAHRAVESAPIDPAEQSVLAYLDAHRVVETASFAVDPAAQSVLAYLDAHRVVPAAGAPTSALVDPLTQAVNDYLRAHGR